MGLAKTSNSQAAWQEGVSGPAFAAKNSMKHTHHMSVKLLTTCYAKKGGLPCYPYIDLSRKGPAAFYFF